MVYKKEDWLGTEEFDDKKILSESYKIDRWRFLLKPNSRREELPPVVDLFHWQYMPKRQD